MVKNILIFTSIILLTLGLVVVSATDMPNANPDLCRDSDGGIHPEVGGYLIVHKNILSKAKIIRDVCVGATLRRVDSSGKSFTTYNQIKEGSCDANGRPVPNIRNITNGFCKMVELNLSVLGLPKSTVGVVVSDTGPSCTETEKGIVSNGVLYQDKCDGNTFFSYSCTDNGELETKEKDCSTSDGFGRCTITGCTGVCSETDPENNINVPGIVTVDGIQYLDVCDDSQTKIKQYTCLSGLLKTVDEGSTPWKSCGKDRICVIHTGLDAASGAAKCVDKTIAGETITLDGLRRIVAALQSRIEALERQIASLTQTPA